MRGSNSRNCDNEGKCDCKPRITGKKCNECKNNFYGFPNCQTTTTITTTTTTSSTTTTLPQTSGMILKLEEDKKMKKNLG